MGDFVKELFGALDKITDILNLGRLIFYTAAGFPPVLGLAMILRTAGAGPGQPYWTQFRSDFVTGISSGWVWAGAVIAGFVVANLAFVTAISRLKFEPGDDDVDTQGFSYQYPRLRTGRAKRGAADADYDFAAWLIAEYYRYVEIAVYVPYGVLLSLPLLTLYSCARILLDSQDPSKLDADFFGLALWAAAAALGWTAGWRVYWLPKIAAPINEQYMIASAEIVKGVNDYASGVDSQPAQPDVKDKKTEKR